MRQKRQLKTGERFNSLVFIKEVEPVIRKSKLGKNGIGYERMMLWRCDCGNEKIIRMSSVVTGYTKTCGCYQKDISRKLLTTHGLYYHPLRSVYVNMMSRCYNPRNKNFKRYGARGIKVCDEWQKSMKSFIIWGVNNGWKKGLTIDRIDNNGNYSKDNCRFATKEVQANNTRANRIVLYKGEEITLMQFVRRFNLCRKSASKYLDLGYTPEYIVFCFQNRKSKGCTIIQSPVKQDELF